MTNQESPIADLKSRITRRHFFADCGVGVGKIALASLLASSMSRGASAASAAKPQAAHFAPRAKRVIYLFQAGAPSQLDLFDYKPTLAKHDGSVVPAEIVKDQRYAFIRRDSKLLAPRFRFNRHGGSGTEISDVLPHLSKIVDEITIIRSMHTDQFNHAPAQVFLNTGFPQPGRPSMGSWVSYGLGAETSDLPAFVVLSSGGGLSGGSANWSSGFLPTSHTGVPFRSQGDAILNVSNPAGYDDRLQRDSLDLIGSLNQQRFETVGDPEITTRINAYEMAYRMQASAPKLMDLSDEKPETLALYGVDPKKPSFARNCLLARRLIERGVRFVNLYHEAWDHHSDVAGGCRAQCGATDQGSAALVTDLKRRGMLDDTLVIWGGEFGRTPMVESNVSLGRALGRDHHPQAFTIWLAGGGIKRGHSLGATDDIGFHVAQDPVHVHDLQATILHILGLDHERLTFTFQGRQYRLTDVHGHLVKSVLA
jgi:uncharacterized protein (DUF1501 family)